MRQPRFARRCMLPPGVNLVMSAAIIVVPALSSSCRRNPPSSSLPDADQPVEQGSVALQGVASPVIDDASAVHDHRARGNVEREPRVLLDEHEREAIGLGEALYR